MTIIDYIDLGIQKNMIKTFGHYIINIYCNTYYNIFLLLLLFILLYLLRINLFYFNYRDTKVAWRHFCTLHYCCCYLFIILWYFRFLSLVHYSQCCSISICFHFQMSKKKLNRWNCYCLIRHLCSNFTLAISLKY